MGDIDSETVNPMTKGLTTMLSWNQIMIVNWKGLELLVLESKETSTSVAQDSVTVNVPKFHSQFTHLQVGTSH